MKMISDYIAPIGPEGLHVIDTGKWRTSRPVMNEQKCEKCGLCFLHCPVFSVKRDWENNYSISYAYCKGCGICAHECKSGAIVMVPEGEVDFGEEQN